MEKHYINIEAREKMTITDVCCLDTFDDEEVCAILSDGGLIIKGQRLHIHMLNLDEGTAEITGEIQSIVYTRKKADKNLLKRFFK